MKIGVDLDSVVFDFIPDFLKHFNNHLGTNFTIQQWTHFHPAHAGMCTSQEELEAFKTFESNGGYLHLKPIPGARPALFRFVNNLEAKLVYITARPRCVTGDTFVSLINNGLLCLKDYDIPVEFTDKIRTKSTICQYYHVDIMIDDRIEYLFEVKKDNPDTKTVLFRYHDNLPIISNPPYDPDFVATTWDEIEEYVTLNWLK